MRTRSVWCRERRLTRAVVERCELICCIYRFAIEKALGDTQVLAIYGSQPKGSESKKGENRRLVSNIGFDCPDLRKKKVDERWAYQSN